MMEADAQPALAERIRAFILTSACFLLIYNGTNYLTAVGTVPKTAYFAWELRIPFLPWMIFPYWSLDLFFVAAPFFARTKRELRLLVFRLCFIIAVAGSFFLLFPLKLAFPVPVTEGAAGALFGVLEGMGDHYNLAPSLHIAIRTVLLAHYLPLFSGARRVIFQIWFFLIAISTLFCWRHHVIDLYTGQLLALVTLHFSALAPGRTAVSPFRRVNASWRLGRYYLTGAFALAALSTLSPPGTLLLLWPASSLAVVASAYYGLGPSVLGKIDGGFAWWTRMLLYPYQLGASISAAVQGRHLPEGTELTPRLWIGKRPGPLAVERLLGTGAAILDLSAELPEAAELTGANYKNIAVLDLTSPSVEQLHEAAAFIKEQESVRPVFVHCALGRSRSAVVCSAFLLNAPDSPTVTAVLESLRVKHPAAILRPEYIRTLEEYAATLKRAEKA